MSYKSDEIHKALYFILEIAVLFSVFSRFMFSYLSFFYTELRGRFFYTIPPPPSKSANISKLRLDPRGVFAHIHI